MPIALLAIASGGAQWGLLLITPPIDVCSNVLSHPLTLDFSRGALLRAQSILTLIITLDSASLLLYAPIAPGATRPASSVWLLAPSISSQTPVIPLKSAFSCALGASTLMIPPRRVWRCVLSPITRMVPMLPGGVWRCVRSSSSLKIPPVCV